MLKVNLSFAKIAATPTDLSWSQAYNAGNFFVVLSLNNPGLEDESILTSLGKQIIDNLEAEFFGLENKNLETIKQALLASITEVSENTELSLALAYIKDQILYMLLYGAGNIILKRGSEIGSILYRQKKENDILSASGYIKQGDVLVIQTQQFTKLIKKEELDSALELTLPNDIAETLAPHIHNSDEGGASAIIISITGVPASISSPPAESIPEKPELAEEKDSEYNNLTPNPSISPRKKNKFNFVSLTGISRKLTSVFKSPRNKKRLLLLITASLIIIFLTATILTSFKKREMEDAKKNFTLVYSDAEEKYKEAIGIKSLNPTLSNEILKNADSIINDNLKRFPKNSEQMVKLLALQKEIRKLLQNPLQGKEIKAVIADKDENPLLSALIDNKDAVSATEDKSFIYLLTEKNIKSIDKNTGDLKELIKNEDDWKNAVSLGTYSGNLYVLDKENGVIKFIVAQNGYGKSDYFTATKPDLTKLVDMTIDGSIWLLSTDSKITKYTRGEKDSFELKGFAGFAKPIQISTNQDINNLYILDTKESRIVQIQKDGVVKTSFLSNILMGATAFTVSTDEKEIFVLSDNKIWKLSL